MHASFLPMRQPLARHLAVSAALFCLAAALSAQTDQWKSYKYPADGFRASFPSEPKLEKTQKEAKLGSILMNSYCAQIEETSLCVAVIDQGPEATGLTADMLFERTKLAVVAAPKTRKINDSDITLDGHKGTEIETANETLHQFTRVYLVDGTIYQAIVICPLQHRYPDAARFLDSFKLIARARK